MTSLSRRIPVWLTVSVLLAPIAPAAAAPAVFQSEVTYELTCGSSKYLVRSQYSNGKAVAVQDGRSMNLVAGGEGDTQYWGPRLDKSALQDRWMECTITDSWFEGHDDYANGWWVYAVFTPDK